MKIESIRTFTGADVYSHREIPKILFETISEEKPNLQCEIAASETEALSKAIREMNENQVVVIFYGKLASVLEILAENQAVPVSSFEETVNHQQAVV